MSHKSGVKIRANGKHDKREKQLQKSEINAFGRRAREGRVKEVHSCSRVFKE